MELNDVTKKEPSATEIAQLLNTGSRPKQQNISVIGLLRYKRINIKGHFKLQVGERFKSGAPGTPVKRIVIHHHRIGQHSLYRS